MSMFLDDYTAAIEALETFKIVHAKTLDEWEYLADQVNACEGMLKAYARENGPEENSLFAVTVQRKFNRWYDADTVLQMAPYVRDIPGVMVTSIDKEKINALAEGDMLPAEVIKAAYRTEPLTSAVRIKAKVTQPNSLDK